MRKIFVALIAASFATLSMGVFAADKVDCKKLEADKKHKWTDAEKKACPDHKG